MTRFPILALGVLTMGCSQALKAKDVIEMKDSFADVISVQRAAASETSLMVSSREKMLLECKISTAGKVHDCQLENGANWTDVMQVLYDFNMKSTQD